MSRLLLRVSAGESGRGKERESGEKRPSCTIHESIHDPSIDALYMLACTYSRMHPYGQVLQRAKQNAAVGAPHDEKNSGTGSNASGGGEWAASFFDDVQVYVCISLFLPVYLFSM